jgi:PTH1 family peptidyl-tRNA hydrolase
MRKLIVGLGNFGDKYEKNRHNVGFLFIEYLIKKFDIQLTEKKLKDSLIFASSDYIFAKPQTYMNESGKAVKQLVEWFDIDIKQDLLLVHDDLDIVLGEYKLQLAKSPKLHNGVISVQDHLGSKDFYRLRIGVDNREGREIEGMKYVLDDFKIQELGKLQLVFEKIIESEDLFMDMISK